MPSRFEIVLPGLDPSSIRLEHLHAVVTGWLDTPDTHRAAAKPYTLTPASADPAGAAVQVATLDDTR
ncbi:hypothetical protein, partial [Mangrovihabitans endophyticus]|uniref:hypothetical protein n=1 Tax=Mangrovihabitans endophyticus TaxID=1751298 RepID=UPI001669637D